MADFTQVAAPQDLQFEHAVPLPEAFADPNAKCCVACKMPITVAYFHAQGQVVCPGCASRIQTGQQKPPAISLGLAALYGAGAAIAGAILYASVAILFDLQIGIVAILIGYMVGKAIRAGSKGLGGRPQQVLAVLLTYFAITSSYVPVLIYQMRKNPEMVQKAKRSVPPAATGAAAARPAKAPSKIGVVAALFFVLMIVAAAPFLSLASGVGGLLTLFIIFIGLRQAWRLTGRTEILLMGPYAATPPPVPAQ